MIVSWAWRLQTTPTLIPSNHFIMPPHLSSAVIRLILLLIATANISRAESPQLLPLETFFAESDRFAEALSPCGTKVAYLGPDNRAITSLWWVSTETPEKPHIIRLPESASTTAFFWVGTDSLLCQSKRLNDRARLFLTNLDLPDPGKPREILPEEARTIQLVGFVPSDEPSILISLAETPTAFPDLYRVCLAPGAAPTKVATNHHEIHTWAWDSRGTPVAGLRWIDTGAKELLRLDGEEMRIVLHVAPTDDLRLITASPDGTRVLVLTDDEADLTHLAWLDLATGSRQKFGIDPLGKVDLGAVLIESGDVLAVGHTDESTRWLAHEPAFSPLLESIKSLAKDHHMQLLGVDNSKQRVLFKSYSARDPGTVLLHDSLDGTTSELWQERPGTDPASMSETRSLTYLARDGHPIPAFLTLPNHGHAPWPLVVFPHGGPRVRTEPGFDGRVQFLANRGYAVLQPNFRGSRGYGKAFMNAGDGQWGTGVMQTDITDGVDHLVREGVVEAKRIAIFGGSYGGYAALAGLAFEPDRYAAGICLFGISDLLAYATHHPLEWQAYVGDTIRRLADPATPEGRRHLMDRSPAHHATAFRAPLLIYHGLQDHLLPPIHACRMIDALRSKGKSVESLFAPDESHGFARPESEMAVYRAIEVFLHQYLQGHIDCPPPPHILNHLETFQNTARQKP